MRSRLTDWWIRVRASYWFIPSLMSVAAIAASIGVVQLDEYLGDAWLTGYTWLHSNQPAGARALLSTVAGSMITVAGVTFSMTLLAVSHASAQIGPRLMAEFMRDKGNQFTLGTFIATFLYCLLVLRNVQSDLNVAGQQSGSTFVPHLAVLLAVALAILSVVVLIYFIHHIPVSISVSNVIARVGDALIEGIQCMYPQRIGASTPDDTVMATQAREHGPHSRTLALEGRGGYLRLMNAEGLLELTTDHELVVQLYKRPGDFGIPSQPLLRIWAAEPVSDEVAQKFYGLFSWGNERTGEQDIMFPTEQLIEVLGKAMSPGVNGQYTALLCLNQFECAFIALLERSNPDARRFDDAGMLRVIARPVSHEEFIGATLRPIRQFVRNDWIASNHLVKMLERLILMPALIDSVPLLKRELATTIEEARTGSMSTAEKNLLTD